MKSYVLGATRSRQSDMRDWKHNNPTFLLIIFLLHDFHFFPVDWDLASLEQCRRAFWLALNPQKEHGSLWIWLWKFSHCHLCVRGLICIYLNRWLEYWYPCVTSKPFPSVWICCCELWSHSWHTVEEDLSPSQSCRKSSAHATEQVSASWAKTMRTIASLLQRRSGQLVGQRVPALHLFALVLQTVYPVLQSVSLRVTAEGHTPWAAHRHKQIQSDDTYFTDKLWESQH